MPDKNTECIIKALLSRYQAFSIRKVTSDVFTHMERDPGCYLKADSFLRTFTRTHRYALALFDREGCGQEHYSRDELGKEVQIRLNNSGWGDRCASIVFDPEIEVWIWSNSPHLERILGWTGRSSGVFSWLRSRGFLRENQSKPERPKEALESVLRTVRKPRSSATYFEVAKTVAFQNCIDPSFLKLKHILQTWFPGE